MFENKQIIDCHVHYGYPIEPSVLIDTVKLSGADAANLVLVPDRKRVSSTPDALMVKKMVDNKYYVFSNLDVSEYFRHGKKIGKCFVKYVKRILKCGADGIKMIEGKPNMRRIIPIPDFDLPCWEPFFAYVEANEIPILWHVNDPEEFWDEEKMPEFAKKMGWGYTKDDINNEVQYKQIKNVLMRHPNIKIIFAHFFFMSKQLSRLSNLLDKYPNMMIDLTPGIEMYINLSANIEEARAFFDKYQNRIMYGTDIAARNVLGKGPEISSGEVVARSNIVKHFVSGKESVEIKEDGDFLIDIPPFTLNPLLASEEIQEKIYAKNFISFVGMPKEVNCKLCLKETKRVKFIAKIMAMVDKGVSKDFSSYDKVLKFFKEHK